MITFYTDRHTGLFASQLTSPITTQALRPQIHTILTHYSGACKTKTWCQQLTSLNVHLQFQVCATLNQHLVPMTHRPKCTFTFSFTIEVRIRDITIKVCGLIKDLEVHLVNCHEVTNVMDVVVINVPDAWGMLLARKWATTLSGSLQMDLSFDTIPIGNGHCATLYNQG